jgi:hypothetical protein
MQSLLTFVLRLVVTAIILLILVFVVSAIWWLLMTKGLGAFAGWTSGTQNSFVQIFNIAGTIAFIATTGFVEGFIILVALIGIREAWN